MDIPIRTVSDVSAVSGESFAPGDRAWSCLVRLEDGSIERIDVLESERDRIESGGTVLCRWGHRIREPETSESELRRAELQSTESVFLSLYEVEDETDEAAARARDQMKYFLSLQLERKRILKPLGSGRYRHMPSKREYHVPQLDLTQELIAGVLADPSDESDRSDSPD